MTAQMLVEAETPWDITKQGPKMRPDKMISAASATPKSETMKDRGGGGRFDASKTDDRVEAEPTELSDMLMPWEKKRDVAAPRNVRMTGWDGNDAEKVVQVQSVDRNNDHHQQANDEFEDIPLNNDRNSKKRGTR